jgi:hypothetical protein
MDMCFFLKIMLRMLDSEANASTRRATKLLDRYAYKD